MSKKLFLENAYGILGLDASATERDILRRAKEIEALLKIDEKPEYDLDVLPTDIRTEKNVSDASQRLLALDKIIKENFFWFYVKDSVDAKAVKLFKNGKYVDAIELLKSKVASTKNISSTALKNLAVFESLVFSITYSKKYLTSSLRTWKEVIESEKQWRDFERIIALNNPNIDHENIEKFRKQVEKHLSSFCGAIAQEKSKPEYYAEFCKYFAATSQEVTKEIVEPIIAEAKEAAKKLKEFEVEFLVRTDKSYLKKMAEMQELVDIINGSFYRIEKLGNNIYNSSVSKLARDDVAEIIRKKAIEIANSFPEKSTPSAAVGDFLKQILEDAYNFSSENSVVEKRIESDQEELNALLDFRRYKDELDSFISLIKMGLRGNAITVLDNILLDLTIGDKFRKDVEDLRQKFSYDHLREPAAYYVRLSEQNDDDEDDEEEYDEQNDDNESNDEEYDDQDENDSDVSDAEEAGTLSDNNSSNDEVSIGGFIARTLIIMFIICVIMIFIGQAIASNSEVNETLNTCRRDGLYSNACKSAQSYNNIKCSLVWKSGNQVIECKKK